MREESDKGGIEELQNVMDRMRRLGGAVVIEDLPGPVGDNNPCADLADKIQLRDEREASLAGWGTSWSVPTALLRRASDLARRSCSAGATTRAGRCSLFLLARLLLGLEPVEELSPMPG